MKYVILKSNVFGEGWKAGDVVNMDEVASRVPLEKGLIEPYTKTKKVKEEIKKYEKYKVEYDKEKDTFKCTICHKNHKIDSKVGQEHLSKINEISD